MSKQLMISMLQQAQTGDQMLSILDSITTEDTSGEYTNQPTLETIEF